METNLLVATRCGEEQHDAKLGALNQLKRLITGVRPWDQQERATSWRCATGAHIWRALGFIWWWPLPEQIQWTPELFLMFYHPQKEESLLWTVQTGYSLTAVSESCSQLWLLGKGGHSTYGDGRVHKAKQKKPFLLCKAKNLSGKLLYWENDSTALKIAPKCQQSVNHSLYLHC